MATVRDIDPTVMSMIKADWQAAPFGHKTFEVEKWSQRIGVDRATIYRGLSIGRTHKKEKSPRQIDGIEKAAKVVAMLKYSAPEHRGIIATRDAKENALLNGLIAPRFADTPVATFDRVIRELGINPQRRRIERFQAERPNQMHHVDGSTSDCFYVAEALPDGDYLLRLHKGHKDYKNKPIPVDGLRPWYYGVVDDHSGVLCTRMVAACGENAGDNIDFLCWAWGQQEGKDLYGLPEKIKGDHGPMMKSPAVKDLFDRLGVEVDPSIPGNKEAHGKIEVTWSKIWQSFERPYFMISDWKNFSITMSELMRRFSRWQERYNANRHRFERKLTKKQAWERISLHGGVVLLPEDALRTVARRWQRDVDQAGCFSIDAEMYEVKGLHDAKVWVLKGVFEEKMVVIDKASGRTYEVENFRPNALGEFRANAENSYQQTRKEAATLTGVENRLYSDQHMEQIRSEVPKPFAKLPTRVKEKRKMINPLATDVYRTVHDGLADFQSQAGIFLNKENREAVAAMIAKNGLSRQFVRDLASEVQTASIHAQHG